MDVCVSRFVCASEIRNIDAVRSKPQPQDFYTHSSDELVISLSSFVQKINMSNAYWYGDKTSN